MGRSPCCDETGLKKGPWTPEEDQKLINYIHKHGHGSWRALPKLAGLNRCGKSCRLRWTNYLRPDIKRGKFTQEEEQTILNLHSILGNKWSAIATHLPGRTDNEIKNFWNTHLKKKLIQMGFDPMTHRPRTDLFTSLSQLIALANLMDHSSLEELQAVRLQSEAAQMAKIQYLQYLLQPPPAAASTITSFQNIIAGVADLDAAAAAAAAATTTTTTNNNLFFNSLFSANNNSSEQSSIGDLLAIQDSIPFSHLPELQIHSKDMVQDYSNLFTTSLSQGGISPASPWLPSSTSGSMSPPPPAAAAEASSSAANNNSGGDACSTTTSSSIGGAQPSSFWPDLLLEDPSLFQDLAA